MDREVVEYRDGVFIKKGFADGEERIFVGYWLGEEGRMCWVNELRRAKDNKLIKKFAMCFTR